MQRSSERILTTHAGSLPRPRAAVDILFVQDRGEAYDEATFDRIMRDAVDDIVGQQQLAGIDVVSDGEMSKISYATYVRHRLGGFEGDSARPTPQDLDDYPEFRDRLVAEGASATYRRPVCRGPVRVSNLAPLQRDITRLRQALARRPPCEAFLTAVSPGTIAVFHPNEYYGSMEAYLAALAAAMRVEYEHIVGAGFLLQVDCPDLAMGRHSRFKQLSDAQFLRQAQVMVEALNQALDGLPRDRVRLHVCWGNYEGPHVHDIALDAILPLLCRARAGALLIEGANPRHDHEWEIWKRHRLPDDMVLVPGVIDTTTNFVEHPELVAQRIERMAGVLGRERVIAGTDCGLGTFAGYGPVNSQIAWAKLNALVSGAAIASDRLWARAGAAV